MAITRCGKCGERMSTLADVCTKCGTPVADAPEPRKPSFLGNMTLHYLLAALLFLAGAWMYGQAYYGRGAPPSTLANAMLYGGLVWYAVARCVSWFVRR